VSYFIRSVVAFISAVAAFYFVYWVGGALVMSLNLPWWLIAVGSMVIAILVARYVWTRSGSWSGGRSHATYIVIGGLVIGGIGFVAGFFGPIIFAPEANQGPLLGILITGPLGFLIGAVAGFVYSHMRARTVRQDSGFSTGSRVP
jgi:hypothetical protein